MTGTVDGANIGRAPISRSCAFGSESPELSRRMYRPPSPPARLRLDASQAWRYATTVSCRLAFANCLRQWNWPTCDRVPGHAQSARSAGRCPRSPAIDRGIARPEIPVTGQGRRGWSARVEHPEAIKSRPRGAWPAGLFKNSGSGMRRTRRAACQRCNMAGRGKCLRRWSAGLPECSLSI